MNQDLKFNDREKIESVKAGTIAALSLSIGFAIAQGIHYGILPQAPLSLVDYSTVPQLLASALGVAISGFLFGMTYRYIIRDDRNPHLKSGAVLAFGLVRAIPQVELGLSQTIGTIPNLNEIWPFAMLALESLILFAIARMALDWAIARNWVKPFNSKN